VLCTPGVLNATLARTTTPSAVLCTPGVLNATLAPPRHSAPP
jgi:hypothetical protein